MSRPLRRQLRALQWYSATVTTLIGVLALTAFTGGGRGARFDEIEVERINVVERDGTLRLAISNAARAPGWVFRGKPFPGRPRNAGMIFYNDEGEENGGLIFSGRKEDGRVSAGAGLMFDRYDQDQVVALH